MLARLRFPRKSARQTHRLHHQQRRALIARLRRLPRAQVKILPLPSTRQWPISRLKRPNLVERLPRDRPQPPLRRIITRQNHGVQNRFRRVRLGRFPFSILLIGVERRHPRPVADALLHAVEHHFFLRRHRRIAQIASQLRSHHRIRHHRVARDAQRPVILLRPRPPLPPCLALIEILRRRLLVPTRSRRIRRPAGSPLARRRPGQNEAQKKSTQQQQRARSSAPHAAPFGPGWVHRTAGSRREPCRKISRS